MNEAPKPSTGIPFIDLLGVEILEAEPGTARLAVNITGSLKNSWDVAHGGVILALMDVTMSKAGRSLHPDEMVGVTVEMKTNFLSPGKERLVATARAFPQGRSMFCAECDVVSSDGGLVAKGLGTFKVRRRDAN